MMKRIFLLLPVLFCMAALSFAQKAKPAAKTKSKPVAKTTRPVKKAEPLTLPLMIRNEDGSTSSYDLQRGDKLVYHVSAGNQEYDFIVTLNDESYEKGIDFNYEMTDPVNKKGHVLISGNGKNNSSKYVNFFGGGEMKLDDACTVWMTGKNFSEMPEKKTQMTIDNNDPETFYRPDNDEVFPVVNIKGKEMKIEGFKINNAADGTGNKTWWINGISSNSLILKMDMGWTIELKEIR